MSAPAVREVAREQRIWEEVRGRQAERGCRCDLRSGMSERELIALGTGCTGGQGLSPGYVCEVLLDYRRRVARSA